MAIETDKLTALGVKNLAREAAPAKKHFDGGGLYLDVRENGSRYWRMAYRFAGRERLLSLGVYPEVSLSAARNRRESARALLRSGTDPMADKANRKAADRRDADASFPKVATAWLAFKRKGWATETHRKAEYVVDTYLAPALRRQSITTMKTKDAVDALQGIPPSLASKARQYLGGIVHYAIREGLREDGRLLSLRGAIGTHRTVHIPAATSPTDVRRVALAVHSYGVPVTRIALQIAMLTAQRPGEVVSMEWKEVDLESAEWRIPAEKMKMRHQHIVPLSSQAVDLLQEMRAYTGGKQYVFPPLARQQTEHLHRDALSNALRRLGLKGTQATHGFRATFRTLGRERLNIATDVLEAQLAHAKRDEVQKAYDRTKFDDARREAMQKWADYLDKLRAIGPVEQRKAA
ncbi:MAG: integrase arm-type DNA-binding domain-containing protein [Pseudomonadota bacterium]|nr:integrase arm-type DNA-binding domain-containing protein [Pseudomonadota bacterium]